MKFSFEQIWNQKYYISSKMSIGLLLFSYFTTILGYYGYPRELDRNITAQKGQRVYHWENTQILFNETIEMIYPSFSMSTWDKTFCIKSSFQAILFREKFLYVMMTHIHDTWIPFGIPKWNKIKIF